MDTSTARPGNGRQGLTRRRGACESCKSRKVRCNGTRPCDQCHRLDRECIYKQTQPTRRQNSLHRSLSEQPNQFSRTSQPLPPRNSAQAHTFTSKDPLTDLFWNASRVHREADITGSPINLTPRNIVPSPNTLNINTDEMEDISANLIFSTPSGEFCSWEASNITSNIFGELDHPSPEGLRLQPVERQSIDYHSRFEEMENSDPILWLNTLVSLPERVAVAELEPRDFGLAFNLPRYNDNNTLELDCVLEASTSLEKLKPRHYELRQVAEETGIEAALPLHARAYLDSLIEICYKDSTGLVSFLNLSHLKEMLASALEDPSPPAEEIAMVYSAIAIGSHLRDFELGKREESSSAFFQRSLHTLGDVLLARDSLRKFQSLVTMLVYARDFELRCFTTLMINAMCCAQNLRLCQKSGVTRLTSDVEDQAWAKRTFWFVYSLAQPYCLRWGLRMPFEEDDMDIDLPEIPVSVGQNSSRHPDYLPAQVQIAKVCSQMRKSFVRPPSVASALITPEEVREFLNEQLEAWVAEIPDALWDNGIPSREEIYRRRKYLQFRLQYFEALLALEDRWINTQYTPLSALDCRESQDLKRCIRTAKRILEEYSDVHVNDILGNRALMTPLLVAVRIIFLAVTLNCSEDEISYLAIACGIFGRLSMGFEVPLAEVIELNQIAQRLCAERRSSDKV